LSLSVLEHFHPDAAIAVALSSHVADWITSAVTLGIFFIPIISSKLFNVPKQKQV
jgi:hypothetical protein